MLVARRVTNAKCITTLRAKIGAKMDGYTVAKAAAAKEKAAKKTQAPPAATPPDKPGPKAKAKGQAKNYVALELAPNEGKAGGDPSQTTAVLQGLATEQAAPAHIADE